MKKQRNSFKNFIMVLAVFLLFGLMHLEANAEENNIATIDDYLDSGKNVFLQDMSIRETQITNLSNAIDNLNKLKFEFVKNSGRDGLYKNTGEEIVISKDDYAYGMLKGYASGNSGIELTDEGIVIKKDGEIWGATTVKINSSKDSLEKVKGSLEEKYGKISKIYSGFTMVGSTNGTTFEAGVTHNTAFDNWKSTKDYLYGTGTNTDISDKEEEKVGKVEGWIAEPLGDGATSLYLWLYDWNIDLTIDGLIYGRMAGNYKGTADFTHFGLEENNPYGIVAASAYYVLRRIILSVLPVVVMVFLIIQLFRNTQKGRAELKSMITNMLFVIALLFIAPYIINATIIVRDGVLKYTSLGMAGILKSVGLGDGVGGSIVGVTYGLYENNHTLLNAIIWCASVGSGFVFMTTYIKIAVLLCGAVAILPIVLLITVWNKKIFRDWWNVFFPNLCVPLVDLVLLQIPSVVLLIFKKYAGSGGGAVLSIILIIIIWNTIIIRDRIIRLLGFEGIGKSGGSALAAIMMLARATGGKDKTKKSDEPSSDGTKASTKESTEVESARNTAMETTRNGVSELTTPIDEKSSYNPELYNETDELLERMDKQYGPSHESGMGEIWGGYENTGSGFGEYEGAEYGNEMPSDYEQMEAPELTDVAGNEEKAMAEGYSDPALTEPVEGLESTSVDAGNFAELSDVGGLEMGEGDVQPMDRTSLSEQSTALSANVENGVENTESASQNEINNNDSDFVKSLDEPGKQRYQNLVEMDHLNEKISQNESAMRQVGYESYESSKAEIERNNGQITRFDNHINASRERLERIEDKTSKEFMSESKTLSELQTSRENLVKRNDQLTQAAGFDRANASYRQEIQRRTQAENTYARANRIGGMDDRTYSSAKEFEAKTRLDQVRKSFATYNNFDSRRYEGILSPSEKEAFYRERAVHERRERYMKVALKTADMGLKVAATGLAVGAGVTMAYGGPSTMANVTAGGLGVAHGANHLGVKTAGAVKGTVKGSVQLGRDVVDSAKYVKGKIDNRNTGTKDAGTGTHKPGEGISKGNNSTNSVKQNNAEPKKNTQTTTSKASDMARKANAEESRYHNSSNPTKQENKAGEFSAKAQKAENYNKGAYSASNMSKKAENFNK